MLNILVGALPLLILFYHIILALLSTKDNIKMIRRLLLNALITKFIKNIFKVRRVKVMKRDNFYYLRRVMNAFGSDYAFPSGHVLVLTSYFLTDFSLQGVLAVFIVAFARVYYRHHTIFEAVCGVVFGVLHNLLYDFIESKY